MFALVIFLLNFLKFLPISKQKNVDIFFPVTNFIFSHLLTFHFLVKS